MSGDGRRIVVTGVAGFIGSAVARRLLADGWSVVGVDCVTPYDSVELKRARLATIAEHPRFEYWPDDLSDARIVERLSAAAAGAPLVHLAAQPGVRYSIERPDEYVRHNLVAFGHVLEVARRASVPHLVFASSSSVYGANSALPYSAQDPADRPVSFYAATKKANEVMAHSYSHLYRVPMTVLRFFTVYGPWGRTDMAPHLFTNAILTGREISLFNHGKSKRDFTFVDDVVESICRMLPLAPDGATPIRTLNIGNDRPVETREFLAILERLTGKKAVTRELPAQPGDVDSTWADISELQALTGYRPRVELEEGLAAYVAWFRGHYAL